MTSDTFPSPEQKCPCVSVCIPTYNGAAFLAEAIRSVLAQSFADFELLIVDDQSTDATLEIARSFTDSRIHIHQNPQRLGIPGNWNRCLSLATGKYFCLFHQDDVMLPQNIEKKIRILESDSRIALVHSAVEFLIQDAVPQLSVNWMEDASEDFVVNGQSYFYQLLLGNRICAPTVITRRQLLIDLGMFDGTLGFTPDYAMWMKLSVEGQVAFVSQPLLLYRWHETNATHAFRFERGIEEVTLARERALLYYRERTKRHDDADFLRAAIEAQTAAEHWAAELDHVAENQRVYIKALEQERDRFWAELQRVGRGWEEQRAYIENLQTYTKEVEQERTRFWEELQRVGKEWEAQNAQIQQLHVTIQDLRQAHEQLIRLHAQLLTDRDQLIAEREQHFPERLWRSAQRVWKREQ